MSDYDEFKSAAAHRRSPAVRLVDWAIFLAMVAAVVVVVGLVVMAAGCSTVTPKPVGAVAPAFDGNEQNGGILSLTPAGFVVTENFRLRYDALASTYGKDVLPPLHADDGLTKLPDGNWLIDRQHMTSEILMADWRRMGRQP